MCSSDLAVDRALGWLIEPLNDITNYALAEELRPETSQEVETNKGKKQVWFVPIEIVRFMTESKERVGYKFNIYRIISEDTEYGACNVPPMYITDFRSFEKNQNLIEEIRQERNNEKW